MSRTVGISETSRPDTFEHALHHLLNHEVDLAHFDARFQNDATGAPAYPPAMLLKVVVFAYSQGIVRSRAIERVCQEHVTFMALRGMTAPHFTTIAHFVSTLRDNIAQVFAAVLAVCDGQGLIGREMFAIDGVKLPSNASKHRSATRAAFTQRAEQLQTAAKTMRIPGEPDVAAKTTARLARLTRDAHQLREWLATHRTERHGACSPGYASRWSRCWASASLGRRLHQQELLCVASADLARRRCVVVNRVATMPQPFGEDERRV